MDASTTLVLVCVSFALPVPPTVSWLKDNVTLEETTTLGIHDEFLLTGGRNFSQSFLTLCSLMVNDTSTYACQAENEAGVVFQNIQLVVRTNAQIVTIPDDTDVHAGDIARVVCVAQGADPAISWTRQGIQLSNDTNDRTVVYEERYQNDRAKFIRSVLEISNAAGVDTGLYTCQATSHMTRDKRNFNLTVEIVAASLVSTPPPQVITVYRSNITITCVARGYPLPQISWFRGGQDRPIQNGVSSVLAAEVIEQDGDRLVQFTLTLTSRELERSTTVHGVVTNGQSGGSPTMFNVSVVVESKCCIFCLSSVRYEVISNILYLQDLSVLSWTQSPPLVLHS